MIKANKNKLLLVLFMTLPTIAGSPLTVLAQDDSTPPPPPTPCVDRADFREFDFWIGSWDVHLADGTVAGSNVITREEAGCVLVEQWTGASGGTGMSVNYVDGITKEWVQVWNSAFGVQIHIRGGMTDAGMALKGTIHYVSNDTTAPFRGLWTPMQDGRVRQYFEQSNDDGETWTPWFEGFYTRRPE